MGTQNYICKPSSTGFSWTLFGPQATLFVTFKLFGNEIQQQIATHFLSANPAENGMARPTWQSSLDTSAVWGKASLISTDTAYVAPGAIPWLLVQVVGAQRGPAGGAMLMPATYIHRLNTSGGVAPSTGCTISTDTGNTALVPPNERFSASELVYVEFKRLRNARFGNPEINVIGKAVQ